MRANVFPKGRGISPFVSQWLTKTVEGAKAVPFSQLRMEHFQPDQKVMHWPPSGIDVDRIVQIAEAVESPDRELPVILDIGAGTGLLSFLIAQTGRAAVIGIDPSESLMNNSIYSHKNLRYYPAGVEWAIENFQGEIDLAVWSWPLVPLEPLKTLSALDPRGALLIFNMEDCRTGFEITDFTVYKYLVNFDDFEGFRKTLLWRGVDCNAFNRRRRDAYFSQDNLFVFYLNEKAEAEFSPPEDSQAIQEYPWIIQARDSFPRFPSPSEVELIGETYRLCPKEKAL